MHGSHISGDMARASASGQRKHGYIRIRPQEESSAAVSILFSEGLSMRAVQGHSRPALGLEPYNHKLGTLKTGVWYKPAGALMFTLYSLLLPRVGSFSSPEADAVAGSLCQRELQVKSLQR